MVTGIDLKKSVGLTLFGRVMTLRNTELIKGDLIEEINTFQTRLPAKPRFTPYKNRCSTFKILEQGI